MRYAIIASLAALLAAPTAEAQRGRRANDEVSQNVEHLASQDPTEVRGALEALGLSGDARAVAPIAERVRHGLPPELLDLALDTLTVLGNAQAGPVLFELCEHRRPEVRLRAVQAVAAVHPPGADRALVDALSDSDASVRSAAATALGELGAQSAVDPLFHALDRRIPEAATAIGRVARPADVERFLGYLGQLPFTLVTPALTEMLRRGDLAERARLSIVHRLSELATPEVRSFLEELVSSLPAGAVRRAAEDAIARIAQ